MKTNEVGSGALREALEELCSMCEKLDRDTQQWNAAFPNKPPRTMKCGYPLPCPWHTVIIDTAGPRVHIPHAAGLSQGQRKRVRALAVQIADGLEDEETARRGEDLYA